MFGINQSKNQQSSASTVNTTDSNNDNSNASHNSDNSLNASGGIDASLHTYNLEVGSGGGNVQVGEVGLGEKLVNAFAGLVKGGAGGAADQHEYSGGQSGTTSVGSVPTKYLVIGGVGILVLVAVAIFAMRK